MGYLIRNDLLGKAYEATADDEVPDCYFYADVLPPDYPAKAFMGFYIREDNLGWLPAVQGEEPPDGYYFSVTHPEATKAVSPRDIDAERDRRIEAGVELGGTLFQSRATDRENILGAAQLGFMAVVSGAVPGDLRWSDHDADFQWIASDNSLVKMDAFTVVELGKKAAQHKAALIYAGRALKDMADIPADYTDDKWWA